jgi:Fe-S cluster biogenesis protein NfuA
LSAVPFSDPEVRDRVAAVEGLLARVEELPGEARAIALDTVQVLVELYGEALERLLGRGGADLLAFAGGDELLSHLLLLHGLHPAGVEERVREALEAARPDLGRHAGRVELVEVAGGTARLRFAGDEPPSSADTLRFAVEQAVLARAPEVERVEIDGLAAPEQAGGGGFVPVEALRRSAASPQTAAPQTAAPQPAAGGDAAEAGRA